MEWRGESRDDHWPAHSVMNIQSEVDQENIQKAERDSISAGSQRPMGVRRPVCGMGDEAVGSNTGAGLGFSVLVHRRKPNRFEHGGGGGVTAPERRP